MTDEAWESLRRDLQVRLPRLLNKALSTYAYFASTTPPEGTKDFAAFQASCRAALAHIHLLIKLVHWAQAVSNGEAAQDDSDNGHICRLIEEAEAAIDAYNDK